MLTKYGLNVPYILCVSALYHHKNIVALVDEFARIHRSLPQGMALVIAGDHPEPNYLREVVEAIEWGRINRRVRLLGPVPYDDLPSLYAGSSLHVFPSLCENFPNILIEGLASGAPTICARVEPFIEIAGDAVEYFEPQVREDLGEVIVRLLRDQVRRKELQARGRARAETFSWQKTGERVNHLLNDVVRSRSARCSPQGLRLE